MLPWTRNKWMELGKFNKNISLSVSLTFLPPQFYLLTVPGFHKYFVFLCTNTPDSAYEHLDKYCPEKLKGNNNVIWSSRSNEDKFIILKIFKEKDIKIYKAHKLQHESHDNRPNGLSWRKMTHSLNTPWSQYTLNIPMNILYLVMTISLSLSLTCKSIPPVP